MDLEIFGFKAGLFTLGLYILLEIALIILKRYPFAQNTEKASRLTGSGSAYHGRRIAMAIPLLSFVFITLSIVSRALKTGHGPFSNMYEFSLAFSWGILLMALLFSRKYSNMTIVLGGNLAAFVMLFFASRLSSAITPLVPALQNHFLLSVHVASAVMAYGAFTISFISAAYSMVQRGDQYAWLPPSKSLEEISYHAVMIGFPFMTLTIVLGAIWADIAWGRYWGWDPKETASLVTWLIYASYLHARTVGKWRGRKTALIIVVGFVAVIFTFFGSYLFNSLHSYR